MHEDPEVRTAMAARGVVLTNVEGFSTKRSRDGEHVAMSTEGYVKAGRTEMNESESCRTAWTRMAILANIKEKSDAAYGNAISLKHWIQSRRSALGLHATVAQEKTLKKAAERAEKALKKVKMHKRRRQKLRQRRSHRLGEVPVCDIDKISERSSSERDRHTLKKVIVGTGRLVYIDTPYTFTWRVTVRRGVRKTA